MVDWDVGDRSGRGGRDVLMGRVGLAGVAAGIRAVRGWDLADDVLLVIGGCDVRRIAPGISRTDVRVGLEQNRKIGRASCRGGGWRWVGAGAVVGGGVR